METLHLVKRKWDENTQTTTERDSNNKNGGLNYGSNR